MSQGFDHTVHHRDKKTGKISRVDAYSLEIHMGQRVYRRDGKCFDGAGVEIADPKHVSKTDGASFTRSPVAQKSAG